MTEDSLKHCIKQVVGGCCCICAIKVPKYKVIYDVSDEKQGGTRLEYYCTYCAQRVYEREPVL